MRPQHGDAGEILSRLAAERLEVSPRPAAEPDERNRPRGDTRDRPNDRLDPHSRDHHDDPQQERHGEDRHLRPEPDRQPGQERPHGYPARDQILYFNIFGSGSPEMMKYKI